MKNNNGVSHSWFVERRDVCWSGKEHTPNLLFQRKWESTFTVLLKAGLTPSAVVDNILTYLAEFPPHSWMCPLSPYISQLDSPTTSFNHLVSGSPFHSLQILLPSSPGSVYEGRVPRLGWNIPPKGKRMYAYVLFIQFQDFMEPM